MKALTVKYSPEAPWPDWLRERRKTIETRTWGTRYRGPLLFTASKRPVGPLSGLAFLVADLWDCRPMTVEDEEAACCPLYPGAWAWCLHGLWPIVPFPVRGSLGLFEVAVDIRALRILDTYARSAGVPDGR